MKFPAIFFVTIRLSFRARYIGLVLFSVVFLSLAVLLGAQFAGRQPATVALDVGISIIRLLLPFVVVMLTQELLSNEFERRYFLSSLSYPYTRLSWLWGRFFAVTVLIFGLLCLLAILLSVLVRLAGEGYVQSTPVDLVGGYLITMGFIALDLLVLTALSSFLALTASTSSFVLVGTFGFMLVARSFAAIIELLARDSSVVSNAESYGSGVGLLAYLLPDLGALDVRGVSLYGQMEFLPVDWPWLLLSCLIYAFALMALAVWAFNRKRFI